MNFLACSRLFIIALSAVVQSSMNLTDTVEVGSAVSFKCNTSSSKPLRWKFLGSADDSSSQLIYNGEEFAEHWLSRDRANVSFDPTTRTGLLSIRNVQQSDSGNYSCVPMMKRTPLYWFNLNVTVKRASRTIEQIDAVVGEDVTLNCTDSSHKRWVQWRCLSCDHTMKKGDRELINRESFINTLFSPRFSVAFNASTGYGELLIKSVEEFDTGNYSCFDQNGTSLSTFSLHTRLDSETSSAMETATQPSRQDQKTTDMMAQSYVVIVIAVVCGVFLLGLAGAVFTCASCILMKRFRTPVPQTVNQVFVVKENQSTAETRFHARGSVVPEQESVSGRELTAGDLGRLSYSAIREFGVEAVSVVDSVASDARMERPETDQLHHADNYEKLIEALVVRNSLPPPPSSDYNRLILLAAVDD